MNISIQLKNVNNGEDKWNNKWKLVNIKIVQINNTDNNQQQILVNKNNKIKKFNKEL